MEGVGTRGESLKGHDVHVQNSYYMQPHCHIHQRPWSKKGITKLKLVLTRLDHANVCSICKTMCVPFCKLGTRDNTQKEGILLKTLK